MCREHVVDVRDDYQRFLDAGGDVAIITMGTVEQTAAFRDRNRLPFVCLADPERIAYQAFGVPRGTALQVTGPSVWARGLKATLRAGIGKPIGDVLQLHGSFIVDRGGVIRFVHIPKHSADQPSNDELIVQLQNLKGGNIVGMDEHR
ncbi:MAG: redoxin domain-containing protein [Planctomycetaceae bacterium]|nr:redoxin domain-containing protein [Planctomycetales bacterium]MCB9873881.1 redoxin domain-containing protein [Planctomycetaceae bacterium]MCB9936618.1 redoxin domain-containing protein [Planctomycetaceae bacterium]